MEILFYIGIILLAIGTWQSFMCGIHSEMISTVSLIIGTILVFVGNWHVGFFFVFVFFSWVLLTQIFNFSTYHRYFPIAVIFLLIHAVIVAILLQKFGFSNFVWWYLILTAGRQIIHHKKQHQQKNLLDSLLEAESEDRSKMEKSTSNTMKYHLLSSILFILAVALAFFYFAGSNNIKHLSNSIDLATKVARISNAGQPYERVPEKDIKKIMGYSSDAAHQVDMERLNSDHSGLGDHYRDEFIKGAKLYVEGLKQSASGKLLLGQVLSDRWGTWYSSNTDKIRKL